MKLSEIFWSAANLHLDPDNEDANRRWDGPQVTGMSCCAAAVAEGFDLDGASWKSIAKKSRAVQFMRELGCGSGGVNAFNLIEAGEARQGARYAWLMFASMYAEEQGL